MSLTRSAMQTLYSTRNQNLLSMCCQTQVLQLLMYRKLIVLLPALHSELRESGLLVRHKTAADSVEGFAEQADKAAENYQAAGFHYGKQNMDAELDSPHQGESYKPDFDIPVEYMHVMQGMTEQQHKVRRSLPPLT